MKNVNTLLIITFLFICQIGNSQVNPDLLTKKDGKYYYKTRFYTKKNVGRVLAIDEEAFEIYKKYEAKKNSGNIAGYLTLGAFGIGTIAFFSSNEDCSQHAFPICGYQVIGTISFGTAIIFAPISIAVFISANRKLKKSIKSFNKNIKSSEKLGSNYQQLNLQVTNNGLGLVLSF